MRTGVVLLLLLLAIPLFLTAYAQEGDTTYSSPGLEGLREAIDKHACEMEVIENNGTSMDKLKCSIGDLIPEDTGK